MASGSTLCWEEITRPTRCLLLKQNTVVNALLGHIERVQSIDKFYAFHQDAHHQRKKKRLHIIRGLILTGENAFGRYTITG